MSRLPKRRHSKADRSLRSQAPPPQKIVNRVPAHLNCEWTSGQRSRAGGRVLTITNFPPGRTSFSTGLNTTGEHVGATPKPTREAQRPYQRTCAGEIDVIGDHHPLTPLELRLDRASGIVMMIFLSPTLAITRTNARVSRAQHAP